MQSPPKKSLEERFRTLLEKKSYLRTLLRLLGKGYGALIYLRNWAYTHQLFSQKEAPLPLISVGNIAVGGTGKTPLVLLLSQELSQVARVAILSRGYRSRHEKGGGHYVSPHASFEEYGDEPSFLAGKLPHVDVFVGKDRYTSALAAAAKGAELLILDDGMQHRQLARDIEIVMVDAKDPLGRGFYLPGGLLRDNPQQLQRATYLVANQVENREEYESVKKELAAYTSAPIIGMQLKPTEDMSYLQQKAVGIFCAIAAPLRFQKMVESLGAYVVGSMTENDHMPFSKKMLESFAEECRAQGAEMLLCTEKDWVKLPECLKIVLPIYPIKVGLSIVAGESIWQHLLERCKEQRWAKK